MILSCKKGMGYVNYRDKQKMKKIFFHLSEMIVPNELEELFPSKQYRTTWMFARGEEKGAPVSFEIGTYRGSPVAENIILTSLSLNEITVLKDLANTNMDGLSKNQKKKQNAQQKLEAQQQAGKQQQQNAPLPLAASTPAGDVWGVNNTPLPTPPDSPSKSTYPPMNSAPAQAPLPNRPTTQLPIPPPGFKSGSSLVSGDSGSVSSSGSGNPFGGGLFNPTISDFDSGISGGSSSSGSSSNSNVLRELANKYVASERSKRAVRTPAGAPWDPSNTST